MRRLVFTIAGTLATFAAIEVAGIGGRPSRLDPSFGTDGRVVTDFDGSLDEAFAVAVQPNGTIVAAGWSGNAENAGDFALARYTRDGRLDPTFGEGGKVRTTFGSAFLSSEAAHSIVLQPDGKIVAAGWSDAAPPEGAGFDFALARYHADGSLDSSFGIDGRVLTDFGAFDDIANAIALEPNGQIVAAGVSGGDFAIARYNRDGSLDATFGVDGIVLTDLGGAYDEARAVAILANGEIVVAGTRTFGFALVRYHEDGSLDASFGNGGQVVTDFGGSGESAYGIALQPHGKIVAAGASGGDFALARYDADGSLDTSFGSSGLVLTDFGSNSFDVSYAVASQSNGTIVAAGSSSSNVPDGLDDFAVARYTRDGTLDQAFGTGGLALIDFGSPSAGEAAFAVAVQPNGNVVVAGRSSGGGSTDFSIARYTSILSRPDFASTSGSN
jgi:uncharacterized delta-60 repeat protein